MNGRPSVVALCGSQRDGSYTRTALEHALSAARAAGARTTLLDLRELDLPPFDPDLDEQGASADLTSAVREADVLLLGTPVYHGSYSSTLKNALDYCGSDEFEAKTVGLLAVAGGSTYASTLDHLRVIARSVHAWVLPHQVGIPKASSAFAEGELVDEALRARVERLGEEAVAYANIAPDPVRGETESTPADD